FIVSPLVRWVDELCKSAIDYELDAEAVRGIVRGKEQRGPRHLFRLATSPQGNGGCDQCRQLLWRNAGHSALTRDYRRLRHAGAQHIDSYAPRQKLDRQGPTQSAHRRLTGTVDRRPDTALLVRICGADEYDSAAIWHERQRLLHREKSAFVV